MPLKISGAFATLKKEGTLQITSQGADYTGECLSYFFYQTLSIVKLESKGCLEIAKTTKS